MKFNKLSFIIASALCVLSNPTFTEDNNEIINEENNHLNKRSNPLSILINIALGAEKACAIDGWEAIDKWPCCKFRCDSIKSNACKAACRNYKTNYPACGNNCKL
ncbi:hypothetical protein PIROE2DRAFT_6608 [Piromyces sp. E2]|nr:hypothetical protein PIROE2DRAFT_6608 [Piromyces sp. E2]|eukprot:OUM66261.1 hypothetical protein PIROE2DRAFT_6608 [Piromyces sp. E2]